MHVHNFGTGTAQFFHIGIPHCVIMYYNLYCIKFVLIIESRLTQKI